MPALTKELVVVEPVQERIKVVGNLLAAALTGGQLHLGSCGAAKESESLSIAFKQLYKAVREAELE